MGILRQYILSAASAAVVCSVVMALPAKGVMKEFIRLLCGAFLAVSLLGPLGRLDWAQVSLPMLQLDADDITAQASMAAREALEADIKQRTEAYILDKAREYDLEIQAEVVLGEEAYPLPRSVTIQGAVAPYLRLLLEAWLETELGIPKEEQSWQNPEPSADSPG